MKIINLYEVIKMGWVKVKTATKSVAIEGKEEEEEEKKFNWAYVGAGVVGFLSVLGLGKLMHRGD